MTIEIACVIIALAIMATNIGNFILTDKVNKLDKKISESTNNAPSTVKLNLSIDEINKHIDTIFDEIKQNKYLLYFKLRELTIIPNMDDEITNMTTDVIHAFSAEFRNTLYSVYSEEYVIQMITRRAQQFMVDYIAANKPKSK